MNRFLSMCSGLSLWIFCFVCVVFKQKTAYEMRISDWSSDVCSSDLLLRIVDHLGVGPGLDVALEIEREAAARAGDVERLEGHVRRAAQLEAAAREIGRA